MLVTPTGRFSSSQPDTGAFAAPALAALAAAASSAARLSHIPGRNPTLARYIVVMPFLAWSLALWRAPRAIIEPESAAPLVRPRGQGGRLVDAADQALQPHCQTVPLLIREKAPQLALPAVRLDGQP